MPSPAQQTANSIITGAAKTGIGWLGKTAISAALLAGGGGAGAAGMWAFNKLTTPAVAPVEPQDFMLEIVPAEKVTK